RIALAACLLLDIFTTYGIHLRDLYGPDSLSRVADEELFAYLGRGGEKPNWYWSLFRGFDQPVLFDLSILLWVVVTGWIVAELRAGGSAPLPGVQPPRLSRLLAVWLGTSMLAVFGVWTRASSMPDTLEGAEADLIMLGAAVVPWLVASVLAMVAIRAEGRGIV